MALRYVEGTEPGYSRRRKGDGWHYFAPGGQRVRNASTIARLNALALPPAYTDAWFARDARAHLQATGIDDRGRKQYRYHPDFRAAQELAKYDGCGDFGRQLPKIRAAVARDLAGRGKAGTAPDRDRVIAAVVRLLDVGALRVGNRSYARDNKSFGATTLRNRHVTVKGERIRLYFIGKSGKPHKIDIADRRLAAVVRQCHDLPGQNLFQYLGDDGALQQVRSDDVNAWLRALGSDFTAKHFRTFTASALAFGILARRKAKAPLKDLLEKVSARLGNTPAIARKSYIHPALIEIAQDEGRIVARLPRATKWLSAEERGFIDFLDALPPA